MELTPLQLYILFHLKKVGMDYAKSIARTTETPIEEVVAALDELEAKGLIERVSGATVKRSEAKLKMSKEVHKHHTYYSLSKEGKELWKKLRDEREASKAIDEVVGDGAWELMKMLRRYGYEHAVMLSKLLGKRLEETQELLEKAVAYGIIHETKPKTLKAKHRKAKAKRETRCQHKYYKISRLGELLLRSVR